MLPLVLAGAISGGALDTVVGGSLLSGVAAYLGYEYLSGGENQPPVMNTSAPSGKKSVAVPPSTRPSVSTPLKPAIDEHKKSLEKSQQNFKSAKANIEKASSERSSYNFDLQSPFVGSPLLSNQIELKSTLDEISFAINAQSSVLAMLVESLDRNFALVNASVLTMAQNSKVLADMQTDLAANSNYGDSDFFYAFVPSSQFWSQADQAQNVYDEKNHTFTDSNLMPSMLYLTGEMNLIDNMDSSTYTKSDIRKAVEEYRKNHLSSAIRALIGATLVQNQTKSNSQTSEASDYYKTATNSIKSGELTSSLAAVASAIAPVAQWANQAKVRETFLQTPTTILDLDGNKVVENVKPMEMTAAYQATRARTATDVNSDDYTNDLPSIPDLFPVLQFSGRGSVFDHNFTPTENPFTAKNLSTITTP